VAVALAAATLGFGLAGGAPSSTPLLPGAATTITKCTTSLTLSTSRSPARLACAAATTSTAAPTTTTSPTTTTTTQPAGGGTCTAPIFTTSNPEGTINTDPSGTAPEYWWVDNDAWSSGHGPQTIYVCSPSSWYATSTQPDVGGQVETYPDTEYDVGGRSASAASPAVDPTIAAYAGGSIASTFAEAYPSAGGWDAAYDLWTDDWAHETMIWNQWAGSNSYWPGLATTAVTLGGVGYKFYDNGGELMFFRDAQVTSGSVDLLAAWEWEVANGYASASDVPTQIEYGVEVSYTTGTETFPTTSLTVSVTP
jgi:hypothetical protein